MTTMNKLKILEDKYCLVYCGPERCNCMRGNSERELTIEELRMLSKMVDFTKDVN